ncbi:MAG: hypothetical protein IPH45_03770 [Bacteroidales bacterium]|nr:hypothetical protein [Bacteroidales bacterium]
MKSKNTGSIEEMEKQPAYMRRNVELQDTNNTDDTNISRYTLNTENASRTILKEGNPFFTDNVD